VVHLAQELNWQGLDFEEPAGAVFPSVREGTHD